MPLSSEWLSFSRCAYTLGDMERKEERVWFKSTAQWTNLQIGNDLSLRNSEFGCNILKCKKAIIWNNMVKLKYIMVFPNQEICSWYKTREDPQWNVYSPWQGSARLGDAVFFKLSIVFVTIQSTRHVAQYIATHADATQYSGFCL